LAGRGDGRYAPSIAAAPLLESNRVLILTTLGEKNKITVGVSSNIEKK